MKARFKYPIYPNIGGKKPISKAPQVVSVKYKPSNKKPTNSELQKQFITLAKKTEKMVWLSEVFLRLPLQQSLNDV